MRRGLLAPLLALLWVCACGSSTPRATPSVLLPDVGPGYRVAAASGPLSEDALASATAVPRPVMSSYLRSAMWRSAGERVWTSSADGFVTDIVTTFGSPAGAAGLVALAARSLPGPATRPFSPPGLPEARGFVQTSDVDGKTMFCVIGLAHHGAQAFVVTRCTPYPQDTATVSRLLVQQLSRAG